MGILRNITKQFDSDDNCCYIEANGELLAKVYSGEHRRKEEK